MHSTDGIKHGTVNGYLAHRRKTKKRPQSTPCGPCRTAWKQHQAKYRKDHPDYVAVEAKRKSDTWAALPLADRRRVYGRQALQARTPGTPRNIRERGRDVARRPRREGYAHLPAGSVNWRTLQWKLEYHGHSCWLCGVPVAKGNLHWDHVKPLAAGGPHLVANMRPSCPTCNTKKGNKWPYSVQR